MVSDGSEMKQRPSKYQRLSPAVKRQRVDDGEVRRLLDQMEQHYRDQLARYHAAMQAIVDGYTKEDRTHELVYLS
jgi:hypothetical protein